MKITLPDGNTVDAAAGATPRDIAKTIGEGLAKAAIGARVNPAGQGEARAWEGGGELIDADRPIDHALPDTPEAELGIVTAPRQDKKGRSKFRDAQHEQDALYLLRHSTAHVMAEAIEKLYPDTQLAYGPPLDTGFYYDLKLDTPISSDDFAKIEEAMSTITAEDRPFTRYDLDAAEGKAKLDAEGNKYKLDNADKALGNGAASLSFYVTGEAHGVTPWASMDQAPAVDQWEDLCQGPHVDRTSRIGAFKVMSVAASNWHGDINSDRFQRVYGTAFFSQADLDDHLDKLEQARQRDHKVVGPKLGLFTIDEQAGQGLVLWKPKGAIIRQELQNFITEHLDRQGYSQVFTPHIGKLEMYRTSGHFPYYADSQFPPLVDRETVNKLAEGCSTCAELADTLTITDPDNAEAIDAISGGGYLLKPMNCPHHIRIYASEKHSYRDLPIRLYEFGTVYRWEQSGELGGMTRVRGFTQDDAHLFVTPDQLATEVAGCLELVKIVFGTLGMDDYRVRVGLRDPDSSKYVGDPGDWDAAEAACKDAAKALGVPFVAEAGEAAFYGPKIDFVVRDVIGREWQLGTVQVDYQLPQRFDLSYTASDNTEKRPVMIHRAPFGSMERFVGLLIEHFNGAFPLWLSPEQARVLPISDKFVGYARKVEASLKQARLRASVDAGNDRLGAKVGKAEVDKVAYMLVVGGRDAEAGTVSVRHREKGDLGARPLDEAVAAMVAERDTRALTPTE
ncbi:MAG: threonine--tRNA ligase [Planctomycetota bacterium]